MSEYYENQLLNDCFSVNKTIRLLKVIASLWSFLRLKACSLSARNTLIFICSFDLPVIDLALRLSTPLT